MQEDGEGMEVDLRRDEIDKVKHKVREAWRWKKFEAFKRKNRRDSREMGQVVYDGLRLKAAREMAGREGAKINLIVGAFMSPAAVGKAGMAGQDGKCLWCKREPG